MDSSRCSEYRPPHGGMEICPDEREEGSDRGRFGLLGAPPEGRPPSSRLECHRV